MSICNPCYQEVELDGIKYEVYFWFWPGTRGSSGRYGEPLEPDDPPEIDITKIFSKETQDEIGKNLIDNETLRDKIEEQLWKSRK